jgi:hypothetical protein
MREGRLRQRKPLPPSLGKDPTMSPIREQTFTIYTTTIEELQSENKPAKVWTCNAINGVHRVQLADFVPHRDGTYHLHFHHPKAQYSEYPEHWPTFSNRRIPALLTRKDFESHDYTA